jgi:hypothetical protein
LNWASFYIFIALYIKRFAGLPIDELVLIKLEYLPPIRVSAPDLHVRISSIALDVPGLVVVSGPDSQRLLMEVPDLGSSTVSYLNDHVSVVDDILVSIVWELGDYV